MEEIKECVEEVVEVQLCVKAGVKIQCGDQLPDDLLDEFCSKVQAASPRKIDGFLTMQSVMREPDYCRSVIQPKRDFIQILYDEARVHFVVTHLKWGINGRPYLLVYDPLMNENSVHSHQELRDLLPASLAQQILALYGNLDFGLGPKRVSARFLMDIEPQMDNWSCGYRAIGVIMDLLRSRDPSASAYQIGPIFSLFNWVLNSKQPNWKVIQDVKVSIVRPQSQRPSFHVDVDEILVAEKIAAEKRHREKMEEEKRVREETVMTVKVQEDSEEESEKEEVQMVTTVTKTRSRSSSNATSLTPSTSRTTSNAKKSPIRYEGGADLQSNPSESGAESPASTECTSRADAEDDIDEEHETDHEEDVEETEPEDEKEDEDEEEEVSETSEEYIPEEQAPNPHNSQQEKRKPTSSVGCRRILLLSESWPSKMMYVNRPMPKVLPREEQPKWDDLQALSQKYAPHRPREILQNVGANDRVNGYYQSIHDPAIRQRRHVDLLTRLKLDVSRGVRRERAETSEEDDESVEFTTEGTEAQRKPRLLLKETCNMKAYTKKSVSEEVDIEQGGLQPSNLQKATSLQPKPFPGAAQRVEYTFDEDSHIGNDETSA